MTSLTLSLLAIFSTLHSPYIKPKEFSLMPELTVNHELTKMVYVKGVVGALTQPESLTVWNPMIGHWTVEAGLKLWNTKIGLGHKCEHAIGSHWRKERHTESYEYLRLEYTF